MSCDRINQRQSSELYQFAWADRIGAISISNLDFIRGSIPSGNSTWSHRKASEAHSRTLANFSPSVRNSSSICIFERGDFTSACSLSLSQKKSKPTSVLRCSTLMDLRLHARHHRNMHKRLHYRAACLYREERSRKLI